MTAVEVLPAGAPEAEWLAARRKGIGASEISAVLGYSPHQSPFGLWWSKKEGWELSDNSHMEAGRRLEPVICDWFADRADPHENLVLLPGGLYRSGERPWQLATPDRLICLPCAECDGTGYTGQYKWLSVLCKTCIGRGHFGPVAVFEAKHPYDWTGFGDENTADIPLYYLVQVLQQCDVMGVDEWFLGAYAQHEFRVYRGVVDADDIRIIRTRGAAFWASIEAGEQPSIDSHPATLDALKLLHPTVEDRDIQVDVDFAEGYRRARAMRSRVDALVDRYEARARQLLGSARRLMCGRQLVVSRSVYDRTGEDYYLHALDEGYPTTDRLNPGRATRYVRSA